MPGLRAHTTDPVDPPVATPAIEDDVAQLPLEFALRLEQLHPEALRGSDESRLIARVDFVGLLDHSIGVCSPIRKGTDG
jgi:hypothetical protein